MSVVKINAITVPPGGGAELERRFAARLPRRPAAPTTPAAAELLEFEVVSRTVR